MRKENPGAGFLCASDLLHLADLCEPNLGVLCDFGFDQFRDHLQYGYHDRRDEQTCSEKRTGRDDRIGIRD